MAKDYTDTLAIEGRAALLATAENQHDDEQRYTRAMMELASLSARISSVRHEVDKLTGKSPEQNEEEKPDPLIPIRRAIDGLSVEIDELESRIERYAFALLIIVGLVLWLIKQS